MKSTKRSEVEAKIKEWIERYPSVKRWFLKPNGERRHKFDTEKRNLKCLEAWCNLLNKNPDELVPSNLKEAEAIQIKILAKLLDPLHLKQYAIDQHMTKYHSFCKFNGFKFPYGGDQMKKILRSKKWNPAEVKELISRLGKERAPKS